MVPRMNVKSYRFKRRLIKPSLGLLTISILLLPLIPQLSGWVLTQFRSHQFLPDPQFEVAYDSMLQISEQTSGYASILGGLNQYGISQLDYDTWRQLNGKSVKDLIQIDLDEVKVIYREHWQQGNCNRFDAPLDVVCLDTMLSFGAAHSRELLANLPENSQQAALEVASRRERFRQRQVRPPVTPSKKLTMREGLRRDRALADWAASAVEQPPSIAQPLPTQIPGFPLGQPPSDQNNANQQPSSPTTVADRIYQQLKPVTVEVWNNSQRGIATTASGVVLTNDGLILTNHHVIETNPSPSVKLADGRKFEAEILSIDPSLDLALLQLVGAHDLPVAPFADNTSQVQAGDTVYAIGSPMGESWKMTSAQVIELHSTCANGVSPLRCIRTPSGFLKPGNSGGPLINAAGQVIGINRAVQQSTGEGVSIPVETIRDFLKQRVGHPETIKPESPKPRRRWF